MCRKLQLPNLSQLFDNLPKVNASCLIPKRDLQANSFPCVDDGFDFCVHESANWQLHFNTFTDLVVAHKSSRTIARILSAKITTRKRNSRVILQRMNIKPKSLVGAFVIFAASFLVGCPKAPLSYKLQRMGTTTVLIPPNLRSPVNEESPQLVSSLKKARRRSVAGTNCDIEGHVVNLHWHGKAAEIRVESESYIAERGMYLDPLQDIGKFHEELLERESKGCFSSTEARRIRRAVAERFPLPPSIAYRYELGSYDTTGFFELTPDFRLNVVSPIYQDGQSKTIEHQLGYEVSYYSFKSAANDDRITASLISVTEFRTGEHETPKTAPRNRVDFPASPNHYRLVLKAERSSAKQITLTFLLGSPDEQRLNAGTKQLQAASVDSCQAVTLPGMTCIAFPFDFGVTAELRVRANGREAFVQLDGIVLDALGQPNISADVPTNLRITRLYQGRRIPIVFDPVTKDIFRLSLMPGDELAW
jgi:hypothetical protein